MDGSRNLKSRSCNLTASIARICSASRLLSLVSMFLFSSYFVYFIFGWKFGGNFLGVKIREVIFGFRPQPNQFFLFGPQKFLPNFVKIG